MKTSMVLVVIIIVFSQTAQQISTYASDVPNHRRPFFKGLYRMSEKITGGEEVQPHSIPWQVALTITRDNLELFCGGSLISANFVITAAHCMNEASKVEVILGAHNLKDYEPSQIRMVSEDFIVHQEFSPQPLSNDISLIKLPEPVVFGRGIQPVRLPIKDDAQKDLEGLSATESGWGKTEDGWGSTTSDELRSVETKIISNEKCDLMYFGLIDEGHICSDGSDGKSTCNGDSGGPLTVEDVLVGITSFGIVFGCESGWPAAFTRVTKYLEWIEKNSDVEIH